MKPILPMVEQIPYADYAARPGVRWSHLSRIRDGSEAHLRAYLEADADKDTDSTRRGRLLHTLLLEPKTYAGSYVVFEGRRQGKAWDAFAEEHDGKTILKPEDVEKGEGMVASLRGSEITGPYLEAAGLAEGSIFWKDPTTGLDCKARPDWLTLYGPRGGVALVDIKTARTLDERSFGLSANRYGYHAQLAHYRQGLRTLGVVVERVVILGVESAPPFDVGAFVLDDAALDLGDAILTETMGRYARALQTNQWPGRFGAEVGLKLPDYVFGSIEIEDAE